MTRPPRPPMSWEDYVIGAGVQIVLWPPEPPYARHDLEKSALIWSQLSQIFGGTYLGFS